MRTRVYRNLHNGKWSLQQKINGSWLVVAHCDHVLLSNCELKVSEAGRQRVIKEKKKNVHAFIIGDLEAWEGEGFKGRDPEMNDGTTFSDRYLPHSSNRPVGLTYNPYTFESFVTQNHFVPVHRAPFVKFEEKFVYGIGVMS
jgi:hypothetical protein